MELLQKIFSLQQQPLALYAGPGPVSSSVSPDSITPPTLGYNILLDDISMTVTSLFTMSHISHV